MASLPMPLRQEVFRRLNVDQIDFLLWDWNYRARDSQMPPPGDWRCWLFLGGRGAGKMRAGAEWVAEGVRSGTMRRIALIGASHADVRSVMIEGHAGLKSVCETAAYEPANRRVLWACGAVATVLSADEPDAIRGHQFDAAWADEFAKWPDPQGALDMLRMTMRLGEDPRLCITTTPRNIAALKTLMDAPGTIVTKSATRANASNLAAGFVEDLEEQYGGTRLGRQELDGDLIEDNDSALWKRDWIERTRVPHAPPLAAVVVGVDPPVTQNGDECGIVVVGKDGEGAFYVLADRSAGRVTPTQWSGRVIDAFTEFVAGQIVVEANQGGEMIRTVLEQEMKNAPIALVYATRDKYTRAMPIASLYERGRVHHVGAFPELEDQLCRFDGTGKSPDRLDALVWALSHLSPMVREPKIRSL
jgi:phage terminase large subunit-like protein